MKVLHVVTRLQKVAGISVFCAELANELIKQGDQVTVAVASLKDEDRYSLDGRVRFVSIQGVMQSSDGFDVIHIHGLWHPILHPVSTWAKRNQIPVIWSPLGMLAPWAMAHKRWKKTLPWYLYQRGDLKRAVMLHVTSEKESGWICDLGFIAGWIAAIGKTLDCCAQWNLMGRCAYEMVSRNTVESVCEAFLAQVCNRSSNKENGHVS